MKYVFLLVVTFSVSHLNGQIKGNINTLHNINYKFFGMTDHYRLYFSRKEIACSHNYVSNPERMTDTTVWLNLKMDIEKWTKIIKYYNDLDSNKIMKTLSPSNSRDGDGAMYATIEFVTKSSVYTTEYFDHGNPMPEFKPIVDLLLSIPEVKKFLGE